jgi:hypothetical protein
VDAAFGRFDSAGRTVAAAFEGADPGDPLDQPYRGRKRSAVEQAVLYAPRLKVDWYLVTNLRETRLYCKRDDTAHFERFTTAALDADEVELRRLVFLLRADRVAAGRNHLDDLHAESKQIGRELTAGYHREYRDLRARTLAALRRGNPGTDPPELLPAVQKVLDRVLFVAVAEDRGLLRGRSGRCSATGSRRSGGPRGGHGDPGRGDQREPLRRADRLPATTRSQHSPGSPTCS